MGRSSWKLKYVESSLVTKVSFLRKTKGKSFSVKTRARSCTICSDFVGLRFRVHNGKDFVPFVVMPDMIGHKLGEFVPTRVRYEFKKKKKKK